MAYRLASVMVEEAEDSKPIEVIAYGLEILLSIITQMSILLLVGYLLHILPTLVAALLPAIFSAHCPVVTTVRVFTAVLFYPQ